MDRSLHPPLLQSRACGRVGSQRVTPTAEHFSNNPPPNELMSLSISSRSPATTPKQSLDDVQVGYGICASCAPHRGWSSGRLFSFPRSPTYHAVTRSVVNEPAAHITVRPCQAITVIQIGYYENSGTVSLSTCRPSHVPRRRNVRARLRCPTHVLQCSH